MNCGSGWSYFCVSAQQNHKAEPPGRVITRLVALSSAGGSGVPAGGAAVLLAIGAVASFYYWRKMLGPQGRPERRPQPVPECDDAFQQVTVVPAAVGVSIHLPGGAQIEVGSERLDTVRAVIAEVARADRDAESEHGPLSRSQAPAQKCGVASC